MNNRFNRAKKIYKGDEFVAKNPRNGLWYGIDNVLMTPCTDGHKTEQQAKTAWIIYMSTQLCCMTDATNSLLSSKEEG